MRQSEPLISVITPTFNASAYIVETIESVRSQSWTNWEMVIVDDCSTDDTREKLRHYSEMDERIRIHFLKENSGAAIARNTALQHAGGRYVAFLDSDDFWKPRKLEKQFDFMESGGIAFSFTGYEWMNHEGQPINKTIIVPAQMTYNDLLKNTIIGCLTVMIDREKVGPIQMPNLRTRQDLATWLSILKRGFVAYGLNENLANYRAGNPSISKNKWKAIKMNWHVYRKVEELNLVKAGWCLSHYAFNALAKRI